MHFSAWVAPFGQERHHCQLKPFVAMEMGRTWEAIWLTGNVVHCWLSGRGWRSAGSAAGGAAVAVFWFVRCLSQVPELCGHSGQTKESWMCDTDKHTSPFTPFTWYPRKHFSRPDIASALYQRVKHYNRPTKINWLDSSPKKLFILMLLFWLWTIKRELLQLFSTKV